jgi:hypothetical protein
MIGYDLVRAVIGDVEKVIAEPIEEFEQMPLCQRVIVVNTKQGEPFRLVLQAEKRKSLEFRKKPKNDWLTPKVYKGKSMHEEEAEDLS